MSILVQRRVGKMDFRIDAWIVIISRLTWLKVRAGKLRKKSEKQKKFKKCFKK